MKQQKIRLEIARATRLNVVGAARTADLNIIEGKNQIGKYILRALGCFYSGGDYWN